MYLYKLLSRILRRWFHWERYLSDARHCDCTLSGITSNLGWDANQPKLTRESADGAIVFRARDLKDNLGSYATSSFNRYFPSVNISINVKQNSIPATNFQKTLSSRRLSSFSNSFDSWQNSLKQFFVQSILRF